jgi:hypothetical protein
MMRTCFAYRRCKESVKESKSFVGANEKAKFNFHEIIRFVGIPPRPHSLGSSVFCSPYVLPKETQPAQQIWEQSVPILGSSDCPGHQGKRWSRLRTANGSRP